MNEQNTSPIHITPCSEKQENISTSSKGWFCQTCQKNVHFFLSRNDIQKLKPGACGIFRREDVVPVSRQHPLVSHIRNQFGQRLWVTLAASIGFSVAFGKMDATPISRASTVESVRRIKVFSKTHKIIGKVTDKSSGEVLAGASVKVFYENHIIAGALADEEGQFELDIPLGKYKIESMTLQVNYLGHTFVMENLSAKSQNLHIQLNGEVWMEEIVIEGQVSTYGQVLVGVITRDPTTRYVQYTGKTTPDLRGYNMKDWIQMNHSDISGEGF